jgi:hypothetical protein
MHATENITIGGEGCAGTEDMDGMIDEVKIIGRALTDAEIAADYNTSTSYYYNFTSLSEGNYNISLYGFDLAGNTDFDSRSITISLTSCTCAGLNNNWLIDLTDNCEINADWDLGTGSLTFENTGNVYVNATVSTVDLGDPGNGGIIWIRSNGIIMVS